MQTKRLTSWSDEADRALAGVVGEDRAEIVDGVNAGRLELYRLNSGQAYVVLQADALTRELIVVCLAGCGMHEIRDWLASVVRDHGLKAARFFTQRPALARLVEGRPARYPLKLLGYVYRWELS